MTSLDLPENWPALATIRHLQRGDLPALEWDGQYSHFRRVYAEAFERSLLGLTVIWVADLPPYGLIAQVFIQLKCQRPELADGGLRAYLYSFRVKPPFQNAGLGTRMMRVVELDLIERGYKMVTLNVAKDNPRARALYERLGYRVVDQDPGIWSYIDHNGRRQTMIEPAWRMEKTLSRESIPAQASK
jgi:ribosomal protein S18 acetylase RimI-like enzyme